MSGFFLSLVKYEYINIYIYGSILKVCPRFVCSSFVKMDLGSRPLPFSFRYLQIWRKGHWTIFFFKTLSFHLFLSLPLSLSSSVKASSRFSFLPPWRYSYWIFLEIIKNFKHAFLPVLLRIPLVTHLEGHPINILSYLWFCLFLGSLNFIQAPWIRWTFHVRDDG